MPGRGSQTFKKRQKEQERKERAQEKLVKRLDKKNQPPPPEGSDIGEPLVIDTDDFFENDRQDLSVA